MKTNENEKSLNFSKYRFLAEFSSLMDKPVAFLGFIWLILIIIDLIMGLNPYLLALSYIIWIVFILDFLIGLIIAPAKFFYIKKNWITAISVLLPAFGMLRFFRVFRTLRFLRMAQYIRSLNFLRLTSSARRGIKSTKKLLRTNSFGLVIAITIMLIFVGAGGLAYFENPKSLTTAGYDNVTGISSYAEALWWTSMIITTIGTNYWPVSLEGRVITFILAVYSFSFFGYIAANLASHFIKSD